MSLQHIWNAKLERVEWVDLSYILGKNDVPDPRYGQPVETPNTVLQADTPSALCPKCGLPLVTGLGCIDCD